MNVISHPADVIVQSDHRGRRELHILQALRRTSRLSQRELAQQLGMSVGLLNRCVRQLIEDGYVRVHEPNVRPFAYRVTAAGEQYCQDLTSDHYHTVVVRFMALQRRIESRLQGLMRRGMKRVVFYGAGEIMDVTQQCAATVGISVVGAVDDDEAKHGLMAAGLRIHAPNELGNLHPDAVLITTFRHSRQIRDRMRELPCTCSVWQV